MLLILRLCQLGGIGLRRQNDTGETWSLPKTVAVLCLSFCFVMDTVCVEEQGQKNRCTYSQDLFNTICCFPSLQDLQDSVVYGEIHK